MNRIQIFQQVYGDDYVFTAKELERLRQVSELIVRECAEVARKNTLFVASCDEDESVAAEWIKEKVLLHFGVDRD